MIEKLVIIGNGMAPGRMLEHLLDDAPGRYEVAIFNAEPRVNYDRIMLSPVLSGEKDYEQNILHGDGWYIRNGITDRQSTRRTPDTNAHLVCRLLLEKKTEKNNNNNEQ